MSAPEPADDLLLCYCTGLTVGELRRACAQGRWPLADKDATAITPELLPAQVQSLTE